MSCSWNIDKKDIFMFMEKLGGEDVLCKFGGLYICPILGVFTIVD